VFVVLRTDETPSGFINKYRQKKKLKHSQPESVATESGLPFFMLDIPPQPNERDWLKIEAKCEKYASKVVASRKLKIPDSPVITRFLPSFIPSVTVFNTAVEILSKASLDPHKITVTLTDRNAVHVSRMMKLLPFSSTLKIVTSREEKYEPVVQKAFDEFGAAPIIRHTYTPCSGKEIVICTDSAATHFMNQAAVFGYKNVKSGKISFCGSGIELSDFHSKIIPQDIDTVDFADAVTRLCISGEYKNSSFSAVTCSCSRCENTSAENCLRCYCEDTVTKL